MLMKRKMRKTKMRTGLCLTGLLLSAALLTGCGSSGGSRNMYSEMAYDEGGYAATDTAAPAAGADMLYENAASEEYYEEEITKDETAPQAKPEEAPKSDGRKLIKTVDLYAETENYDALLAGLDEQIAELGGYVEYQYQYNGSSYSNYDETRNAQLSVRIPVKRLDEFIRKVGEQSNITNKEERVEDVTLRYVDLESRKKALVIEQDRLLELLEKAETVEDIIAIEQRLSEVRYELENMESQLRTLNNQIDYSTVNISIQEVRRLTPTEEKTVWDRMKNGFVKSIYRIGDDMENGFISFVINIPYIIIWIIVIAVVLLVVRFFLKRRRCRKAAEEQKEQRLWEAGQRQENTPVRTEQEEEKN